MIIAGGPEEHMLGTTFARLHVENPKLDKLPVDSMAGMCSMMMSMAIAVFGIAWFAARREARWAPWVLLVSSVAWVPYYCIIASALAAFGATGAMASAWMVSMFAIPGALGSILMIIGGRRGESSLPAVQP